MSRPRSAENSPIHSMTREEMRIEVLRIAYRPDKDPEDIVTRAKVFEEYVIGKKPLE